MDSPVGEIDAEVAPEPRLDGVALAIGILAACAHAAFLIATLISRRIATDEIGYSLQHRDLAECGQMIFGFFTILIVLHSIAAGSLILAAVLVQRRRRLLIGGYLLLCVIFIAAERWTVAQVEPLRDKCVVEIARNPDPKLIEEASRYLWGNDLVPNWYATGGGQTYVLGLLPNCAWAVEDARTRLSVMNDPAVEVYRRTGSGQYAEHDLNEVRKELILRGFIVKLGASEADKNVPAFISVIDPDEQDLRWIEHCIHRTLAASFVSTGTDGVAKSLDAVPQDMGTLAGKRVRLAGIARTPAEGLPRIVLDDGRHLPAAIQTARWPDDVEGRRVLVCGTVTDRAAMHDNEELLGQASGGEEPAFFLAECTWSLRKSD